MHNSKHYLASIRTLSSNLDTIHTNSSNYKRTQQQTLLGLNCTTLVTQWQQPKQNPHQKFKLPSTTKTRYKIPLYHSPHNFFCKHVIYRTTIQIQPPAVYIETLCAWRWEEYSLVTEGVKLAWLRRLAGTVAGGASWMLSKMMGERGRGKGDGCRDWLWTWWRWRWRWARRRC